MPCSSPCWRHVALLPTVEEIGRRVLWVKQNVARNPYIPHDPTPRQTAFLALEDYKEVGFGGAAGGGKSVSLLMAALLYIDRPDYSALILRRTFSELSQRGALMDMAADWIAGKGARWNNETHTWKFPSGATLAFGYLEAKRDKERYKSANYHYCAFDEATSFDETDYKFLFSRIRRKAGSDIPGRLRSATNPGGPGAPWYKQRFLTEGPARGRPFVRSTLADNPHIDRDDYVSKLMELDPVTCSQLLRGDWDITVAGNMFRREWFPVTDTLPRMLRRQIRWWDTAATEESESNKDPDWTVGLLLCQDHRGQAYIVDVVRGRWGPGKVEEVIANQAILDGREVSVRWGEEPGSAGKHYSATIRRLLRGYDAKGVKETGPKEVRARAVSAAASHGEISVLAAKWYSEVMEELEAFPGGHDDVVDCLSGAYSQLTFRSDSSDLAEINRELAVPTGLLSRRPV
jgi:predicted phage terminase large subunit-like protein